MKHTPDDPARCPKCGGAFKRYPGGGSMMVCENAYVPRWYPAHVFGMTLEPKATPECDQDPMYLVPSDA